MIRGTAGAVLIGGLASLLTGLLGPAPALADGSCRQVTLAAPEGLEAEASAALDARLGPRGAVVAGLDVVLPQGMTLEAAEPYLTVPGRLTFHAVIGSHGEIDPEGPLLAPGAVLEAQAAVVAGLPALSFRLDAAAAERFGQITSDRVGEQIALALDGRVLAAPRVMEPILGQALQVSGEMAEADLGVVAELIAAPLPAPLTVVSVGEVACPAGQDAGAGTNVD